MVVQRKGIGPNLPKVIWTLSQNRKIKKAIAVTTIIIPQTMVISCGSHHIKTATTTVIWMTQGSSGTLPTYNKPSANTGRQEMAKIVRWLFSMKMTIKLKFLSEQATWEETKTHKTIR